MKTQDIINMGLAWKQVTEKMSSKEKMKKGLYNSNDYVIPEDVPVDERDMFMAKAAAAHKAGKTSFTMPGGKKHPVTMKKDTARAVNSSANEENVTEGDAQTADRTPQMYVDPNTGKKKVRMVPHDKQIVDKDKEGMKENKQMALQKALQKSAQSSEKGKAAVTLPKAPFKVPAKEMSHDKEDEMKKKPAKGKDDTAEANPKMKNQKNADVQAETSHMRPNSVKKMKEAMMQMWQEANDREHHYKGATKPDGMKDNRKGKGAEDMMKAADDAAANPDTTVEKGMDDAAKAGRAGPKAAARSNDNMKGDKSVINPVKKT